MREARHSGSASRAAALAVLALCAVGFWIWSAAAAAATPPPASESEAAANGPDPATVRVATTSAPVSVSAAPQASERTPTPPETGTITGTVRIGAHPVGGGFRVHLAERSVAGSARARQQRAHGVTDTSGRFFFRDLRPGHYTVSHDSDGAVDVDVTAGALATADLRLLTPAIVGRVTSRGEPLPWCRLEVRGDRGTDIGTVARSDGAYQLLVGPGHHRITVSIPLPDNVAPGRPFVAQRLEVDLPDGVPFVQRDIDLALTHVEFVADPGGPADIEQLVFELAGCCTDEGVAETRVLSARSDGATETNLPPGSWTVHARGRAVMESAPVTFETSATLPRARIVVPVQPAGLIELEVKRKGGGRWLPPAHSETLLALLPRLVAGKRDFPCTSLDADAVVIGRRIGFAHVPVGPARIVGGGRIDRGGEVEFLPFEPLDPIEIDVHAGVDRAEVFVEPRAFVTLVACEQSGREDPRGHIRVYAGDRPVRPACSPEQSRWQAFLPPGEYRAAIERPDGVTETAVFVQRESLILRLRP